MIDVLSSGAVPFTVAFALVISIGVLEFASLMFGLSVSSALDSLLPDLDADLDVSHPGHDGALAHLFSWLSIGKVPAMVLLVLFLTVYALSGWTLQAFWQALTGAQLPALTAGLVCVVPGLFGMGRLGRLVARFLPKEEGLAPSRNEFVGSTAHLFRGDAAYGAPAEARVTDRSGRSHWVLVEPKEGSPPIKEGEDAVIVKILGDTGKYQIVSGTEINNESKE